VFNKLRAPMGVFFYTETTTMEIINRGLQSKQSSGTLKT